MDRRPLAVEVFCGAGGMTLGFEQAGFDVVAAIDFDPIHAQTHATNFPRCKTICADVSKLTGEYIRNAAGLTDEKITVLFGGPPCQGFSLMGKRKVDDPRNKLLHEFSRILSELRPMYFVVENVAGLTVGHAKTTLQHFLNEVQLIGYRTLQPTILNASDFGIPQSRRRLFILGYLPGNGVPIYPTKGLAHTSLTKYPTVWDAIGDLPNIDEYDYLLDTDWFHGTLNPGSEYAQLMRRELNDPYDQSFAPPDSPGLSGCARVIHSFEVTKRFEATRPGECERISRFYRLDTCKVANTLRAGSDRSRGGFTAPRPIHPVYPRCITVREAARLQSFPDWFQFNSTKWHGFRQVGNSVPPLLARTIALQVMEAYKGANAHV